mmetsp:Transcript_6219/g.19508  ORF Transcript_6219/g.19508 Transcript_6219/m.19508 type:complete len:295 (+) Transcript_6219:32-916(+)
MKALLAAALAVAALAFEPLPSSCARRRLLDRRRLIVPPLTASLSQTTTTEEESLALDDFDDDVDEDAVECLVIRFVTGNAKKLREVAAILEEEGLPLPLQQISLDLDELQSDDPEKIAAAKCALAAEVTGGPVLVDDTSLCLEALGGCPGPFVKWFCGDDKPRDLLVRVLDGFESKRAYALSCMAFAVGPNTVPLVFQGRVDGTIVEPSGESTGWDGSFVPDGANVTFADMSLPQKNAISHRSQALKRLSAYLHEHKELLIQLCGEFEDKRPENPPPAKEPPEERLPPLASPES